MQPKQVKDAAARRQETALLRSQLADLGLPTQDLAGMMAALDEFENHGVGITRTWRFPGFGVGITLLLATRRGVVSYARLGRL